MRLPKLSISDGKPQFNISVRNMLEFLMQEGDIDDRKGGGDPFEAMQAGSKIHKKLQKAAGSDYHAEVPLKLIFDLEEIDVAVEGRADGIIYELSEDGSIYNAKIDEIKCTKANVMKFKEAKKVHLAQAKSYGLIFALDNELDEIEIQVTYVDLIEENTKVFCETYKTEDLYQWFFELLEEYKKWCLFILEHKQARDASLQGMPFPFDYRQGQNQLCKDVYRTISREKILFVQAPTGTGKTVTTIYPAVMATGQGLADKVFYLTAKNSTAQVAKETYEILREKGYKGNAVQITAKDKACVLEERHCNPIDCKCAKGHFDRVNDALFDLITHESVLSRDVICEYAIKHNVCPFELSLDASLFMDNIICDYNYVFDPNVYLKRFFAESSSEKYVFLVDESHNMVDRAREMYSAYICKEEVLLIKRIMKNHDENCVKKLERLNKCLLNLKRECDTVPFVLKEIDLIYLAALEVEGRLQKLLVDDYSFGADSDVVLDFYFKVRDFTSIAAEVDLDHYKIYADFLSDGDFVVNLMCIDPSNQIQKRLDFARSTIYFSATLLPINYYKDLLCEKKDVYAIYAESIFDKSNRCLLIGNDVTSKYTARGENQYKNFAKYIKEIVSKKPGNYMVFGPSYKFINDVFDQYVLIEKDADYIMQSPNMREESREIFLEEFEIERDNSLVAFCTLGGIFSEGIDLVEDKLIGVIVLGAGLPQFCSERQLMQDFFNEHGKNGFDYAYLYPGMNKVIQAAGRLIRTENDRGVIALLDERFQYGSYKKTFPLEWSDYLITNVENISAEVEKFWQNF